MLSVAKHSEHIVA